MCPLIVKDLQTNIGDRPDSLDFERERERREKRKERGREEGRKKEHRGSGPFFSVRWIFDPSSHSDHGLAPNKEKEGGAHLNQIWSKVMDTLGFEPRAF